MSDFFGWTLGAWALGKSLKEVQDKLSGTVGKEWFDKNHYVIKITPALTGDDEVEFSHGGGWWNVPEGYETEVVEDTSK